MSENKVKFVQPNIKGMTLKEKLFIRKILFIRKLEMSKISFVIF